MILPAVKLATLVLKTMCKPVANRLKKQAGLHPRYRFLFSLSQANHRFTTNVQRRIYGHSTDVAIRPLNEEKAVLAAAELLGELFVFTVAGTALIFEVQRSSGSEARKEEQRKLELQAMKQRDEELEREVQQLKKQLEQLAKGRGIGGLFSFRQAQATGNGKEPSLTPEKIK
ncbi:OPA3-like protein [Argentina anserina]|uniref:OPA3-like protein n=1 Tax=Argentina anserina TaxID=57926 RepID=UPI00217645B1|nr:OPA3-like protein [Potentilla anserina]